MRTIYKYNLQIFDTQYIQLPKEAKILCVQTQNDKPQLWAEVDTTKPPAEMRMIEIFGTGNPMSEEIGQSRIYISTFQLQDGLVFHVYEYTGT